MVVKEAVIEQFLLTKVGQPFQYGVNDCCLFSADYVKQVTGMDYGAPFRGTYDSEIGAARIILEHGGSLVAFFTELLGKEPVPVLLAKVGFVAVCEMQGLGQTAGIVTGARAVFINLEGRFETRQLTECICAFPIDWAE